MKIRWFRSQRRFIRNRINSFWPVVCLKVKIKCRDHSDSRLYQSEYGSFAPRVPASVRSLHVTTRIPQRAGMLIGILSCTIRPLVNNISRIPGRSRLRKDVSTLDSVGDPVHKRLRHVQLHNYTPVVSNARHFAYRVLDTIMINFRELQRNRGASLHVRNDRSVVSELRRINFKMNRARKYTENCLELGRMLTTFVEYYTSPPTTISAIIRLPFSVEEIAAGSSQKLTGRRGDRGCRRSDRRWKLDIRAFACATFSQTGFKVHDPSSNLRKPDPSGCGKRYRQFEYLSVSQRTTKISTDHRANEASSQR